VALAARLPHLMTSPGLPVQGLPEPRRSAYPVPLLGQQSLFWPALCGVWLLCWKRL